MDEPRACIEYQETSVRVFDNIRGVEIRIRGRQEIRIIGAECGALPVHDVTLYPMRIELRGEQIAPVFVAERMTTEPHQTGWRDASEQPSVVLKPGKTIAGFIERELNAIVE